jgi:hypothetical protein
MALVDGLTPALPEGASALFRVTRAAIAEKGRTKLPMARPAAPGEDARPAPELSEQLAATGHTVRTVHAHDGALDEAGWDDLIDEAMTGEIAFPRGGLCISPTPAMTLIDVDGSPPLPGLALAAVPAIAARSCASTSAARSASISRRSPKSAIARPWMPPWPRNWLRAARRPAGAANAPQ